ncbi:MAG: Gfo/Idh/MocA family oxidoreductase [Armatimonadota bacterium]
MTDIEKRTADSQSSGIDRRTFIKATAVSAAAAAMLSKTGFTFAQAAGSDKIRVGVIGCGGRGTGAAVDCLNADNGVEIVAMGDLFPDRLAGSINNLKGAVEGMEKNKPGSVGRMKVTPETSFTGFDAYKKVIASDVDLVILATPPGFRPLHMRAAIEAGKHVFAEKPVAVDGPGVRSVMESAKLAKKKNLGVVVGTQRRHQPGYLETMKRIHDGAIGEVVSAQCYWNQGGLWQNARQPEWSDTEYQLRNWLYYTWLSGDHICEQHVHNLDVINWAIDAHPVKAFGMGGRQCRTDPKYGHIYDHFTIEYDYPNGQRVQSMCRQIDGCANNVGEFVSGTKGTSDPGGWIRKGKKLWQFKGKDANSYVQEHVDLIQSIRNGSPLNEGQRIAESVLTAVMGRMAAYTGQEVTWEQALNSKEDLVPNIVEFGPMPVPPVAMPGQTKLI